MSWLWLYHRCQDEMCQMYTGRVLQQGMLCRQSSKASLTALQSCQEKGWTQLNHKLECKILRDRDFRLLSELDWVVFEDYKIFEVSV